MPGGVLIPRIQLFELGDQPWFPAAIRDLTTDYLAFIQDFLGVERHLAGLLGELLLVSSAGQVVDLCSGGGGPIPGLHRALATAGFEVRFTLTDRYPHLPAFRQVEAASHGKIGFVELPVDARAVPAELPGLRTFFNGFHHFPPDDARDILRDAARAGQPIAVVELPERTLWAMALVCLTPLFVWLATLLIRPFRWRRLFWTYLVPAVPLTCLWDGLVSHLRAYTVAELEALSGELGGFAWRAGRISLGRPTPALTYLLGRPAAGREDPTSATCGCTRSPST